MFTVYSNEGIHELLEKELAFHMVFEHALFFFLGALSVNIFETLFKITKDYSIQKKNIDNDWKKDLTRINIHWVTDRWQNTLKLIFRFKPIGYVWVMISIALMTFWHIPLIFDSAVLNDDIHELQHLSFIAVGAMMFLSLQVLGDSYKIFLLVALASMMGSMGLILLLSNEPIFHTYSLGGHNYAGTYMIVIGLLVLIVVLPFFMIRKTLSYLKSKM